MPFLTWRSYGRLERLRSLPNEGRELLGVKITFTEKRDGENISVFLKEAVEQPSVQISSHNLEDASSDIKARLLQTPEWMKIDTLLRTESTQYEKHYILFGELIKVGASPTRIEPAHKRPHWILFDAWDGSRFLNYSQLYQLGYHYKIPIVKALSIGVFLSLEDLHAEIKKQLLWCRRHHREGIVGKTYGGNQIFFKEKIDLPEIPRNIRPVQVNPVYPPMPQERVLRALQHALDEMIDAKGLSTIEYAAVEAGWKDKAVVMPLIVKHLNVEAREHNFAMPKRPFEIYLVTPLEKIRNVQT